MLRHFDQYNSQSFKYKTRINNVLTQTLLNGEKLLKSVCVD